MKHNLFLLAFFTSYLFAAEQQYQSQEWMAQEYDRYSNDQVKSFSSWLNKYNIPIINQEIISFGCGPATLENELAKLATSVHATDGSKNMIDYAKSKYGTQNNLSFQHCAAENFQAHKLHDLAIAANCVHWFQNKPQAFERIANSLKKNALFFANIETTTNPEAFGVTVFNEMKKDVPLIGSLLAALPNPTGTSRPSFGELHIMLYKDFEIQQTAIESWNYTMTEQEWRTAQLPLLLSTPGAQMLINTTSDNFAARNLAKGAFWCISMSAAEKEQHDAPFFPECSDPLVEKIRNNNFCRYLFNNFLNRCLQKLHKNEDGTYTWQYETTIFVCSKK